MKNYETPRQLVEAIFNSFARAWDFIFKLLEATGLLLKLISEISVFCSKSAQSYLYEKTDITPPLTGLEKPIRLGDTIELEVLPNEETKIA